MSGNRLIGLVAIAGCVIVASIVVVKNQKDKEPINNIASPKTFALAIPMAPTNAMKSLAPAVAFAVTPPEPTINPANPYDPMPLRVGTVGAAIFHYPFCPYAKQSLANYGLEKRINYWTREQVAASGREADHYCQASIFDCNLSPVEFAESGNDPWCGANISRRVYDVSGIDADLAGKTLCNLQGYIGTFVDYPTNCVDGGKIRGSSVNCDWTSCDACRQNPGTDCETICEGCVRVTLALINKVTLGLGDANKDGQLDIDDYLYYHECYSGPSVPATTPCANVFDWDEDGDVDVDDYANFAFSYDSGNESWAHTTYPPASYPNTVINPSREPFPLRTGTEGASYYHRLDCPSVNKSWATHGINKRIDFFSWKQIEDSGRISDDRTCLAGNRNNPSGSLQDCTLDDDGDGTLNCEDLCPEDQNKVAPEICGCGISETDTDNNGTPNCNDPSVVLYNNSFEIPGDTNWFDTGANNSLVEAPALFVVSDQGTFVAFSTQSGYTNTHSHYVPSADWTAYKYVGKMMATDTPEIGVTFFSDYPNSDAYYRLRSAIGGGGTFKIDPHGTSITSGDLDTEVTPLPDTWYHFKIFVRNNPGITEIFAKVWVDGDPEPVWLVHCYDNSATRRTQGSFGVWSMGVGSRHWDNIVVTNY